MHRLAISRAQCPRLEVICLLVADILPTFEQFTYFAEPEAAVEYYH